LSLKASVAIMADVNEESTDDVFNACLEVGFDNAPEWLAKRSEVLKRLRKWLEVKQ